MQATLLFRFPHLPREVRVELVVPCPTQRPRAVANFIFMLTGTLPSSEVMQALQLAPTSLAFNSSDGPRAAGLKPFSETAVVHIDKGVVVEIGSSTTRTIFGGFLPDEPLDLDASEVSAHDAERDVLTRMMARAPGTVLCGNAGMPQTQASRYYILLDTVTQGGAQHAHEDDKEDWHSFAPLGFVTTGLDALCKAAANTAVHPRTLAPLKPIKLSGCSVLWDSRRAVASASVVSPPSTVQAGLEARRAQLRDAATKRTRHADDFYDSEGTKSDHEDNNTRAEASAEATSGFFHVEARFPLSGRNVDQDARAVKRRRTEASAAEGDEVPDTEDATPVTMAHVSKDKPFDFFAAQEDAFADDLDTIRDVQHVRQRHREKRGAKSRAYGGAQHERRRSNEAGNSRRATGAMQKKKLRKRY